MDKKVKTRRSQELAPSHCRLVVDRSGYPSDIPGDELDLCTRCNFSLGLLAARYYTGLSNIPVWFFQIGSQEKPSDKQSSRGKTLPLCFPGMAQLPAGYIYDRVRDRSEESHSNPKTPPGNPIYRDWRWFGNFKPDLLSSNLSQFQRTTIQYLTLHMTSL